MSSMLFLILTALAFMSVSVQCFMALPTSKTINKVASKISKETRLFDKIHDLAAAGDLEYIMDAVNKNPDTMTIYDIDGSQLLHHAAKNGHFEMVKFLCERNPGMINFKNIRFRTPLHFSCSYAGYEGFESCRDISLYLVSMGGDLKIKNKDLMSPLDLAKKCPLGKAFANELLQASEGIAIRPVEIGARRVYWG